MNELINELLDIESAYYYISYEALAFLLLSLVILWLGKLVKDLTTSYSIDQELTHKDNKALAVSYVGYIFAQGIIILGVMAGPAHDFLQDLIGVTIWSLIGIILLNISRVINAKFMLRQFSAEKEIIGDRNVGVGAVQAGAYIGTALVISAIVSGDTEGWVPSLVGTAIFFVLGQVAFIVFAFVYQKAAGYDLHKEMERDNIAAGLSFGLTLIAVGIVLSNTIHSTASLPAFGSWFITGMTLILISRILVDKIILTHHRLDDEIAEDQNWGIALVEGGCAIMIAFLLNASFA